MLQKGAIHQACLHLFMKPTPEPNLCDCFQLYSRIGLKKTGDTPVQGLCIHSFCECMVFLDGRLVFSATSAVVQ